MDLPTYTNIWRIEKRLYKLYDLRLPMPLPLVQIGVFVGIFLPWIILLQLIRVPFHAPWHVVYLVPPGVLTWLATRPVIEGKRLTELMISQVRYLIEARTWARLTPIHEPGAVVVVGRVWRQRRVVTGRVHAGRQIAQTAERQAQPPQSAPALRAQSAPPLQSQGVPPLPGQNAPAQPAAFARPGTPQRPGAGRSPEGHPERPVPPPPVPRPSLQATPHDGTATMPPAARGGRRPESARPESARPESARPESGRPAAAQPVRPVPPEPASPGRPEQAVPPPVRGFPALPAARSADGAPATAHDATVQRDRSADGRTKGAEKAPERQSGQSGTSHHVTRQRNISHEPEIPGTGSRPVPAGPPRPAKPADRTGTPPARSGEAAPTPPRTSPFPPAKPGSPEGRRATAAPQPDRPRPGIPSAPNAGQPPAQPGGAASGRPSEGGRPGQGSPAAPVIPLVSGDRHAKPADPGPVAPEPPAAPAQGSRPQDDDGQRPAEPAAKDGAAAPGDDERAIAAARTDQIVWPVKARSKPPARPEAEGTV
ncbi:MAG: ATPase involved in chromosome partitioning-like protein, partial [Actinoallomurus sp.]|nr:ATPase involved in chromosome partitioning-like protein [Actinoallomurus sp.]